MSHSEPFSNSTLFPNSIPITILRAQKRRPSSSSYQPTKASGTRVFAHLHAALPCNQLPHCDISALQFPPNPPATTVRGSARSTRREEREAAHRNTKPPESSSLAEHTRSSRSSSSPSPGCRPRFPPTPTNASLTPGTRSLWRDRTASDTLLRRATVHSRCVQPTVQWRAWLANDAHSKVAREYRGDLQRSTVRGPTRMTVAKHSKGCMRPLMVHAEPGWRKGVTYEIVQRPSELRF